ncbi:hypothetical protein MGYG_06354 [Nannizzia gypsea CBS 118893]|uniref:Uncharacterized protein n=1 Tax=Arthroderma gypseum (strain ATCC MYA-4604 / CBS 118893) TaxID=535722 RepID=E4UZ27_ARTGP|nr:hypothetical protein MGYG_06354 [Nannizzia gypsea CBS 118893]EFR03357.1 hypothetical protein MGYG_06354 [Nannizzia gypsea CBS 118893]
MPSTWARSSLSPPYGARPPVIPSSNRLAVVWKIGSYLAMLEGVRSPGEFPSSTAGRAVALLFDKSMPANSPFRNKVLRNSEEVTPYGTSSHGDGNIRGSRAAIIGPDARLGTSGMKKNVGVISKDQAWAGADANLATPAGGR